VSEKVSFYLKNERKKGRKRCNVEFFSLTKADENVMLTAESLSAGASVHKRKKRNTAL
jgi:hypothetical protein